MHLHTGIWHVLGASVESRNRKQPKISLIHDTRYTKHRKLRESLLIVSESDESNGAKGGKQHLDFLALVYMFIISEAVEVFFATGPRVE